MSRAKGPRRRDHAPHQRRVRFQLFVSAAERDALRRIAIARGTDASSAIRALVAEELKLLQLGGRTPFGETPSEVHDRHIREEAAGFDRAHDDEDAVGTNPIRACPEDWP